MSDLHQPPPAPGKPDWARDGQDWPNREHSRFVRAGGIVWHVQTWGQGPPLLLLHGMGASTHSWRGLGPLLATHYTLIAPDLPGHGFTETPADPGLSLPGMAHLVARLLAELAIAPTIVVGHSAGAAVALRLILDGAIDPTAAISINGALLPFPGAAAAIFPSLAKLLFVNPIVPRLFSLGAAANFGLDRFVARSTGSAIGPEYMTDYARLFRAHGHVAGALGMMANWDPAGLERDLPRLATPLALIAGGRDATVPPSVAARVAALVPHATLHSLASLGHLAHEEDARAVAGIVRQVIEEAR